MSAKSRANEGHNSQQPPNNGNPTASSFVVVEGVAVTTASPETHDDDESRPPLENLMATATMFETTKGDDGKRRPVGLEEADGRDAPVCYASQFDQDLAKKKSVHDEQTTSTFRSPLIDDCESISVPDDCDSNLQFTTVNDPMFINYSNMSGGEMNNETQPSERPSTETSSSVDIDAARGARNETFTTAAMTRDEETVTLQEVSVRGIAEAYLVDDDLIIATPAKPWWKQGRTIMLLAVVVGVVMIAIALGVVLSKDSPITTQLLVAVSPAPSISAPPSSSMMPSLSPTDCSHTITANVQKISLLNPNPSLVTAAIDGSNLIVASTLYSELTVDRSFYVEFYSMKEGIWERIGHFIKGNVDPDWGEGINTALAGSVAVIGVPNGGDRDVGESLVYIQNSFGFWEEIEPPHATNRTWCKFGKSVDCDGNLIVVTDEWLYGATFYLNTGYIFRQKGGEWTEVQVLDEEPSDGIEQIKVSGKTIAVAAGMMNAMCGLKMPFIDIYAVDEHEDKLTHIQRLELPYVNIISLALEGNQLISLVANETWYDMYPAEFFIIAFQRDDPNKNFTEMQMFNVSADNFNFGYSQVLFTLSGDLLVVGGENHTHIFSRQPDGRWEEKLTLDQTYDSYHLSDRTLIGIAQNEVYSMDIRGCAQPMPTEAPSIPAAPTRCDWVNLTFSCNPDRRTLLGDYDGAYAAYSIDTSCMVISQNLIDYGGFWEARIETREFLQSDAMIIEVFNNPDGNPYYDNDVFWLVRQYDVEYSTCLHPGQYQFVFRAEAQPIYSRPFLVHYKLESNGKVIAQEYVSMTYPEDREGIEVAHEFDMPFDPDEANSPTGGPFTPKPTSNPTISTPPTSTKSPSWWKFPTLLPTPGFTPRPTQTPWPTTAIYPPFPPTISPASSE